MKCGRAGPGLNHGMKATERCGIVQKMFFLMEMWDKLILNYLLLLKCWYRTLCGLKSAIALRSNKSSCPRVQRIFMSRTVGLMYHWGKFPGGLKWPQKWNFIILKYKLLKIRNWGSVFRPENPEFNSGFSGRKNFPNSAFSGRKNLPNSGFSGHKILKMRTCCQSGGLIPEGRKHRFWVPQGSCDVEWGVLIKEECK